MPWCMPRPTRNYQKEMNVSESDECNVPHKPTWLQLFGQKALNMWERWKLRPSLFANLVRGAVTWRRILITFNDHPNQEMSFEGALHEGVRRSLPTQGNFWEHATWRIGLGVVLFLGILGIAMFGWCPKLSPNFLADHVQDGFYLPTMVLLIISACYLFVMAYVCLVFSREKGKASLEKKESVLREPQGEHTAENVAPIRAVKM